MVWKNSFGKVGAPKERGRKTRKKGKRSVSWGRDGKTDGIIGGGGEVRKRITYGGLVEASEAQGRGEEKI